MKAQFLAAILLAATSSVAMAENLTERAMQLHPGHTGSGVTADPTAQPASGSLEFKVRSELLAASRSRGAKSALQTAKADDNSLSAKVMKDAIKAN